MSHRSLWKSYFLRVNFADSITTAARPIENYG
jgi:hypothetical protein